MSRRSQNVTHQSRTNEPCFSHNSYITMEIRRRTMLTYNSYLSSIYQVSDISLSIHSASLRVFEKTTLCSESILKQCQNICSKTKVITYMMFNSFQGFLFVSYSIHLQNLTHETEWTTS